MTKFWGKLFLINFALGVVTGITLEFQFGTNWSRYSAYVGDIFGSLLAIEATAAFFLESTFVGVWIFGWKKLSRKAHAAVMWLVAGATNLSAIWILIANGWMQHPVGFTMRNGRAELTDFAAVVFNKFGILTILHTLPASYILASFFVMGISAYHLLKKQHIDFFTRSFKTGLSFGLVFSLLVAVEGDLHAVHVTHTQPAKLAAMEAHWETGTRAPMHLLAIPSEEAEKNVVQFGSIPGGLSFLGYHDVNAEVKGLKAFPKDERPPVFLTFASFRLMVALGIYFIAMTVIPSGPGRLSSWERRCSRSSCRQTNRLCPNRRSPSRLCPSTKALISSISVRAKSRRRSGSFVPTQRSFRSEKPYYQRPIPRPPSPCEET